MPGLLIGAIRQAVDTYKANRPDLVQAQKEAEHKDVVDNMFLKLVEEGKETLQAQLPSTIYEVMEDRHDGYIELFNIPSDLLPEVSGSLKYHKFTVRNPVLLQFRDWIKGEGLQPVISHRGREGWLQCVAFGARVPKKVAKEALKEALKEAKSP